MHVVMLLCDSAQAANGKLFVLGGGWNQCIGANPISMGLAIKLGVPWNEANQPHHIEARLITEDGVPAPVDGQTLHFDGDFEVGRPPGVKPGTDLNIPIAVNFAPVLLVSGGYRWELLIDGTVMASESFNVVPTPESPKP
jgi:hypothetical protein